DSREEVADKDKARREQAQLLEFQVKLRRQGKTREEIKRAVKKEKERMEKNRRVRLPSPNRIRRNREERERNAAHAEENRRKRAERDREREMERERDRERDRDRDLAPSSKRAPEAEDVKAEDSEDSQSYSRSPSLSSLCQMHLIVPTPCQDDSGLSYIVQHLITMEGQGVLEAFTAEVHQDHTTYSLTALNATDLLHHMEPFLRHILHPEIQANAFLLEVYHITASGNEGGTVFRQAQHRHSSASSLLPHTARGLLYPGRSARYDPRGTPNAVRNVFVQDTREYHRVHYRPSKCLLYVTSPITPSTILHTVARASFAPMSPPNSPAPTPVSIPPKAIGGVSADDLLADPARHMISLPVVCEERLYSLCLAVLGYASHDVVNNTTLSLLLEALVCHSVSPLRLLLSERLGLCRQMGCERLELDVEGFGISVDGIRPGAHEAVCSRLAVALQRLRNGLDEGMLALLKVIAKGKVARAETAPHRATLRVLARALVASESIMDSGVQVGHCMLDSSLLPSTAKWNSDLLTVLRRMGKTAKTDTLRLNDPLTEATLSLPLSPLALSLFMHGCCAERALRRTGTVPAVHWAGILRKTLFSRNRPCFLLLATPQGEREREKERERERAKGRTPLDTSVSVSSRRGDRQLINTMYTETARQASQERLYLARKRCSRIPYPLHRVFLAPPALAPICAAQAHMSNFLAPGDLSTGASFFGDETLCTAFRPVVEAVPSLPVKTLLTVAERTNVFGFTLHISTRRLPPRARLWAEVALACIGQCAVCHRPSVDRRQVVRLTPDRVRAEVLALDSFRTGRAKGLTDVLVLEARSRSVNGLARFWAVLPSLVLGTQPDRRVVSSLIGSRLHSLSLSLSPACVAEAATIAMARSNADRERERERERLGALGRVGSLDTTTGVFGASTARSAFGSRFRRSSLSGSFTGSYGGRERDRGGKVYPPVRVPESDVARRFVLSAALTALESTGPITSAMARALDAGSGEDLVQHISDSLTDLFCDPSAIIAHLVVPASRVAPAQAAGERDRERERGRGVGTVRSGVQRSATLLPQLVRHLHGVCTGVWGGERDLSRQDTEREQEEMSMSGSVHERESIRRRGEREREKERGRGDMAQMRRTAVSLFQPGFSTKGPPSNLLPSSPTVSRAMGTMGSVRQGMTASGAGRKISLASPLGVSRLGQSGVRDDTARDDGDASAEGKRAPPEDTPTTPTPGPIHAVLVPFRDTVCTGSTIQFSLDLLPHVATNGRVLLRACELVSMRGGPVHSGVLSNTGITGVQMKVLPETRQVTLSLSGCDKPAAAVAALRQWWEAETQQLVETELQDMDRYKPFLDGVRRIIWTRKAVVASDPHSAAGSFLSDALQSDACGEDPLSIESVHSTPLSLSSPGAASRPVRLVGTERVVLAMLALLGQFLGSDADGEAIEAEYSAQSFSSLSDIDERVPPNPGLSTLARLLALTPRAREYLLLARADPSVVVVGARLSSLTSSLPLSLSPPFLCAPPTDSTFLGVGGVGGADSMQVQLRWAKEAELRHMLCTVNQSNTALTQRVSRQIQRNVLTQRPTRSALRASLAQMRMRIAVTDSQLENAYRSLLRSERSVTRRTRVLTTALRGLSVPQYKVPYSAYAAAFLERLKATEAACSILLDRHLTGVRHRVGEMSADNEERAVTLRDYPVPASLTTRPKQSEVRLLDDEHIAVYLLSRVVHAMGILVQGHSPIQQAGIMSSVSRVHDVSPVCAPVLPESERERGAEWGGEGVERVGPVVWGGTAKAGPRVSLPILEVPEGGAIDVRHALCTALQSMGVPLDDPLERILTLRSADLPTHSGREGEEEDEGEEGESVWSKAEAALIDISTAFNTLSTQF
ncbi:hypothetical protein KIPB_002238, partial [Kipferlia bialata]